MRSAGGEALARDVAADQAGYGTDPDLMKEWKPGGPWPLTLGASAPANYRGAVRSHHSGRRRFAGGVGRRRRGFHRRVDQRAVSAAARRPRDRAAGARSGSKRKRSSVSARVSRRVSDAQRADRRRHLLPCEGAARSSRRAAKFFAKFRDLTAGGFYTTPVGMKDIGYMGNVPLARFDGPPLEALKKAGLA